MNNLKTKIEVSRIAEGKIAIVDTVVVGELTSNKVIRNEGIEVGFKYSKQDGTLLETGAKIYSWEQVNALWEVVKSSVPADATFQELLDVAFLQAFKIEMASTFGITTAQIEEVV